MASKVLLIAIIVVAIAGAPAFAADYVVGDDEGWTLGVNYTAWAQGKQFYVGDRLIFKYGVGAHNVYKVNGTAFQQCMVPSPSESLSSGNDVITLTTPGRKWYICGVGNGTHCASGMKLVITVTYWSLSPVPAPAPAPAPAYGVSKMQEKKPMNFWNNWKLKIHI